MHSPKLQHMDYPKSSSSIPWGCLIFQKPSCKNILVPIACSLPSCWPQTEGIQDFQEGETLGGLDQLSRLAKRVSFGVDEYLMTATKWSRLLFLWLSIHCQTIVEAEQDMEALPFASLLEDFDGAILKRSGSSVLARLFQAWPQSRWKTDFWRHSICNRGFHKAWREHKEGWLGVVPW